MLFHLLRLKFYIIKYLTKRSNYTSTEHTLITPQSLFLYCYYYSRVLRKSTLPDAYTILSKLILPSHLDKDFTFLTAYLPTPNVWIRKVKCNFRKLSIIYYFFI